MSIWLEEAFSGYEFISETRRTARKEHTCHWCKRAIKPGQRYKREAFKEEGKFRSVAACICCSFSEELVTPRPIRDVDDSDAFED